jgi:exosortase
VSHEPQSNTRGLVKLMATPPFLAGLMVLMIGGLVYYPVFVPPNPHLLSAQSEMFLFEANMAAGAPVLVLSLWLFYRRSHLRDVFRGPGAIAPAIGLLVFAVALFGWGAYTRATNLQLTSCMVLLCAAAMAFGGRAALRAYWLPILFLGFALPISPVLLAAFMFPMQLVTAEFAGLILDGLGVAAIVQGDQIITPSATFIVIETCSGVRTVVTLSMLTVLLIDLFERRGWHALILIGLAPVVAFLVNGIRVVTLVLNPQSSVHSIHNLQGIAMLLVGLSTIYLIDGRLERTLGARDPDVAAGDYGFVRPGGGSSNRNTILLVGIALSLAGMFSIARFVSPWQETRPLAEKPNELLARVLGPDPAAPYPIDYKFIGSVHYLAQAVHRVEIDGALVEIHLGIANEQLRGYSILTSRLAWPASGYARVTERFEEIVDGGPVARRVRLRRFTRSVLSYSWVERAGATPSEWFRQSFGLDRSPLARPKHMLAIRISTGISPDGSSSHDAEERIRSAWRLLAPQLEAYAPLLMP